MNPSFVLSILLLWNVQFIVAQTISDSLYLSGAVQVRYHIQKKDTFCTERYWENGKRHSILWRDSAYSFYGNQNIQLKTYGTAPKTVVDEYGWILLEMDWITRLFLLEHEVYKQYYPNGQLFKHLWWQGDSLINHICYEPNGAVYSTTKYYKQKNHIFNRLKINNSVTEHFIVDTLAHIATRFESEPQQPLKITYYHYSSGRFNAFKIGTQDAQGHETVLWQKDSLRLKVDKHNGLCLYGFRNAQEEWVISPQYESIEEINDIYYLAIKDGKYGILNEYGEIILPFQWDNLEALKFDGRYFNELQEAVPQSYFSRNLDLRFCCRKGNLWGVIDIFGKMILEPVYQSVRQGKDNLYEVKKGKYWGIVQADGKEIVAPNYVGVKFTPFPNLFVTLDTMAYSLGEEDRLKILLGLVNSQNKTLLTRIFEKFYFNSAFDNGVWVETLAPNAKIGFFHAEKGWLLDTNQVGGLHSIMRNDDNYESVYVVPNDTPTLERLADTPWQQSKTNQFGLWEGSTLSMLLPFEYQEITVWENKKYDMEYPYDAPSSLYQKDTLFKCKKQDKYGLFDPKLRKWLLPVIYDNLVKFDDSLYWASYNGKYQFINATGQVMLSETFDTIGQWGTYREPLSGLTTQNYFGVRHDTAFFYTPHSFPKPLHPKAALQEAQWDTLRERYVVETWNRRDDEKPSNWWIEPNGKVTLSPEYQLIQAEEGYLLVQDARTKMQQLVDKQGNKKLFFPEYKVKDFSLQKNWVLVEDSVTKGLGMKTLEGKTILPNRFWAMKRMDAQSVIWALLTQDSQTQKILNFRDYFRVYEKDWQMYHRNGKLLTQTRFELPFDWANHLGIGRVQGRYGLWNAQGQNVLPAIYDKIWYDSAAQIFHLFLYKDLIHPQVGFANAEGQIVIDMTLKNMSLFKNDYAFVETEKGIGLIQKNGQYRIPPEPNAFQKSSFSVLEAMPALFAAPEIGNTEMGYLLSAHQESRESVLDSFKTTRARQIVERLILEQNLPHYFFDAQNIHNQKFTNCYFYNFEFKSKDFDRAAFGQRIPILDISVAPQYIHWITHLPNTNVFISVSRNFQLKNNIWKNFLLDEILNWNSATEAALNQLLFQKISALKNEDVDCKNPQMYMQLVKNCFYVLPEGVQFWMPRNMQRSFNKSNFLPILLTWAELKPFLRD